MTPRRDRGHGPDDLDRPSPWVPAYPPGYRRPPERLSRRVARSSRRVARSSATAVRKATKAAADKAAVLPASLPPGVKEQIHLSVRNLAKVRNLRNAKGALAGEARRLFLVVVPMLAAAPLPVSGWRARLAAGGAGGAGAVVEQAEELADFFSWGGALPSAPLAAAAVFSAWVLHLWIAISARVRQLRAAGREVDPDTLGRELARAYLGKKAAEHEDLASLARGVAKRAVEGWMAGLVPGVGICFDAYEAQRTVARILREPVTAHPPASTEAPGAVGGGDGEDGR